MKQQSKITNIYPQHKVSVVAVTWNLHGSVPPINSLIQLYRSSSFSHTHPDIIIVATQQCQRSLLMTFCCEAKTEWESNLAEVFSGYYLAGTEVMRGMHTALLLKHRLKDYFSIQDRTKMKAGTCGMGNKGAISISFSLLGQFFQVINCHLAPHQSASNLRNQTLKRILDQIEEKDPSYEIILLGDLNYRIQMTKNQYQLLTLNKKQNNEQINRYSSFISRDQLNNQIELKANFLQRYEQGKIQFPPTYKMGVKNNQYNRNRIPGWTDRIFHRKKIDGIQRQTYLCEYDIYGCDHRPVIARYKKQIIPSNTNFYSNNKQVNQANESKCQLI